MKNKKKRNLILVLVVLGVLLFGMARSFADIYNTLFFYKNEAENLEEQIAEQEEINRQLKEKEELIKSDEYVEQMARETLGLVKSDEKVFKNYNDNQ